MAAGTKNRRITFYSPPTEIGTRGQLTGSWTAVATVSAEVIPTGTREFERARKSFEPATMVFRITYPRWFTPTASFRVEYEQTTYDIGYVYDPDQMKRELIVAATGLK